MAAVGLAAFSCTFPDYSFGPEDTETCDNDVTDGTETGTDCGGNCAPCPCSGDGDCGGDGRVCVDGTCQAPCEGDACGPTCSDGKHNGEEADTDCGLVCAKKCAVEDSCNVPEDCIEGVCEGEVCQAAACDDGVWNGSEASEDCGVNCPIQCENDQPCDVDADCKSNTCDDVCVLPLCENDIVDEDEGGEDCGSPDSGCPLCEVGEGCKDDDDCVERVCGADGECAEATCSDEVRNGDESDEDCGGRCDGCDAGLECDEDGDCESDICNDDGVCQAATCDDGVTNGDESDEDCGGETGCERCPLENVCKSNRDCESDICDLGSDGPGHCVSCDDGKVNGSERGEDCGGDDCALCEPGDDCIADGGCVNYLCDNGSCENGIELDYSCGQCGEEPRDKIYYTVTLRNLSTEAIDVSDVVIRYYLSAEVTGGLSYDCAYQGTLSCGQTELKDSDIVGNAGATHVIETRIGSATKIQPDESATVAVTVFLNDRPTVQVGDYSFDKNRPQPNHHRITLHREGWLIWGTLPE